MTNYKAEDLTPGMVLRGSRGVVTLGLKLPNALNKKGVEMVRFKCVGRVKTYTTPVGNPQYVIAVPARKEKSV